MFDLMSGTVTTAMPSRASDLSLQGLASRSGSLLTVGMGSVPPRISECRIWPPRFAVHASEPAVMAAATSVRAEDGPGERRPAATHPQPDEAEHAECFDEPERDQRRLLVRLHPGLYVTRRTLDGILRRFTSEVQ